MSERKRWRVALLFAGAVLGLAGFSSAAAGADGASAVPGSDAWRPVVINVAERAPFRTDDDPVLGLIMTSGDRGVGYAVSTDVRFAIGYDYVTEESLDFEVAETGALSAGYAGHEVMVRALWQF